MGKASRKKRERREGDPDEIRRLAAAAARQERRVPVFWIAVTVLVVGAIVAFMVTAPDDNDEAAERAGADAPTYADVEVTGEELPTFTGNDGRDAAVGKPLPTLSGTLLDASPGTFAASDGAQAIIVVAHWCPHCQAEIPRIQEWAAKDGNLPDGVQIRTVSTAVSDDRPNFPPATWLAREDWEFPVLADDEAGTAADALGLEGFPFMVFVNADGTVASRSNGEMPIDEFADRVGDLAPGR